MKNTISPEPALLGFLVDGPLHGYDLYRRVNRELGPIWHLGMSQMYAILKGYEHAGWIGSRIETRRSYPARKMLALTRAGRQAFDAWLAQTARGMREFRIDFFLRLYFAQQAGHAPSGKLIELQMKALRREIASLESHRAALSEQDDQFLWLAQDFRIHQLSTVLKWLDTHRHQLAEKRGPVESAAVRATTRRSRRERH